MDTFDPGIVPSIQGTVSRIRARDQSVHYSMDVYHDAPDGIHTGLRQVTLVWDDIGTGNADQIVTFLRAHIAVPFVYVLPWEATTRLWVPKRWTRTFPYYNRDRIEVQLDERPWVT